VTDGAILRHARREPGKVVPSIPTLLEVPMRKMILMAIAGFLWKKFQARGGKQTYSNQQMPRY
jgi:hypothetical protein